MKLYCATTNPGKLREFRLIIEHFGADTLENIQDIEPPEETGATFEENAAIKAVYYSKFAPGPLFADDSGLAVDVLGGAPGVYSARYAGEHVGDAANNQLLFDNLRGIENRTARFVCVIALAELGRIEEAHHYADVIHARFNSDMRIFLSARLPEWREADYAKFVASLATGGLVLRDGVLLRVN